MEDNHTLPKPPTLALRELAYQLNALRVRSGLTVMQVLQQAKTAGYHHASRATLYRAEAGVVVPTARAVAAFVAGCGVPDDEIEDWLALRRAAVDEGRHWTHGTPTLSQQISELRGRVEALEQIIERGGQ